MRDLFGLDEKQVFIPYLTFEYEGRVSVYNVMEGYCFVRYMLDDSRYLKPLESSPFLKTVLHSKRGRTVIFKTVLDRVVDGLRAQLSEMAVVDLEVGMKVEIVHGVCQGLEGTVVSMVGEDVGVHIKLRSLETVRVIPKLALLPAGEDDE